MYYAALFTDRGRCCMMTRDILPVRSSWGWRGYPRVITHVIYDGDRSEWRRGIFVDTGGYYRYGGQAFRRYVEGHSTQHLSDQYGVRFSATVPARPR